MKIKITEFNEEKDLNDLFLLNKLISPDEELVSFQEDLNSLKAGKVFVIKDNGISFGFISVALPFWNNIAMTFHFVISQNYRNKSYGSMLLNHVIDYAKLKEINFITIRTAVWNFKAISFYRKHGFIPRGVFPDYLGEKNDMLWLERDLRK